MRNIRRFDIIAVLSLLISAVGVQAQGTAFTYQGRLITAGEAANGPHDFRFTIYAVETGGSPITGTFSETRNVSNGLFTATLDFSTNVFDGGPRWLEIGVRTNGSAGEHSTLVPRQRLTATPYAMTAGSVSGPISPANFAGTYSNAVSLDNPANRFRGTFEGDGAGLSNVTVTLPPGLAHLGSNQVFSGVNQLNNPANNFAGTFSGNGAGLSNVNAGSVGGLGASDFWQLDGNGGTAAGTHFLGTTDNQPMELRVNNRRALRLEEARDNVSVNVIAGAPSNLLTPGLISATIAGGGPNIFDGTPQSVGSDFGTIGGGAGNRIGTNSNSGTISGGFAHRIDHNTFDGTIAGGYLNTISSNSAASTIGGGTGNLIQGSGGTVAGGSGNSIGTNSWGGTVGGGGNNRIEAAASAATIGGGFQNTVGRTWASMIGGGSDHAVASDNSGIASGWDNTIEGNSYASFIGGGIQNLIARDGGNNLIAGGWQNTIRNNAVSGAIGGGGGNAISNGSYNATIPGGAYNVAAGNSSFAAGQYAHALHAGAFVWQDSSTNRPFASTTNDQFLVRAAGGVGIGTNNPRSALHVAGIVTATGFNGPAAGLSNVNASTVGGMSASNFWQLSGNAGTTAGTHFLGTTDNQPVEIKVNGTRALRLEHHNGFANVIGGFGGFSHNVVDAGVGGATIGGGGGEFGNRVSGYFGTVGGGADNLADRLGTTSGGRGNQSTGDHSSVPGGYFNTAAGSVSFAAGTQAKALHNGTFVWSDLNFADFSSTAENQFLIRASGGVGVGLNNPQAQLHVASGGGFASPQLAVTQTRPGDFARVRLQSGGPSWDIALSPGTGAASSLRFWNGAWDNLILQDNGNANLRGTLTQGSDRNVKERLEPVDTSAVLEKVAALPLSTWSYTNSPAVRHLGPMAQDFRGAFGLGDTDRGIASVDADGVALAAIQGLNKKLEDQLERKDTEIEQLKARLEKLERLLGE